MAFFITLVISMRPWYWPRGTISVVGWWQGQYEKGHVLICLSYILPGQITCYCPRKMLSHRRQITRRILCFNYTCKFGVISIKYVIIFFIQSFHLYCPISGNTSLLFFYLTIFNHNPWSVYTYVLASSIQILAALWGMFWLQYSLICIDHL